MSWRDPRPRPLGTDPSNDGNEADEAVARNRSTPARSTPGRTAVGADVTNRLRRITGAALLVATLVLVAAILAARAG